MAIDLNELKQTANRQATYATVELLNDWPTSAMLALIEVAEAARVDLAEHADAINVGGSGDFYNLRAALAKFKEPA